MTVKGKFLNSATAKAEEAMEQSELEELRQEHAELQRKFQAQSSILGKYALRIAELELQVELKRGQ